MSIFNAIARAILLTAMLLSSKSAMAAKVCFGEGEQIHFVMNVPLKDVAGNDLAISRKFTSQCFLLPYHQRDDGFVLTLQKNSKQYYPFPNKAEIHRLQVAGLLPQPLPAWETGIGQQIIEGQALWYGIGITVLLFAYRRSKQA